MSYSLAFSTCPNDTFMFHRFLVGNGAIGSLDFENTLLDIQELNNCMDRGVFDFCKVSSVNALRGSETYRLCQVGASLGFGVGPLLLKRPGAKPLGSDSSILCPGAATTATALFEYFYPQGAGIRQVLFSEIMPALASGTADYGVVIHEGRFTYQDFDLELVADLGSMWEERFSLPLPLGCIVAHKRVDPSDVLLFERALRDSISYAYSHREAASQIMQEYAQELKPDAIWAHVDLYVNQWSIDLAEEGQRAFAKLAEILS